MIFFVFLHHKQNPQRTAQKYAMHCVKCKAMYKRSEYQLIKRRIEEPRKFIQMVMGPRQVGKSTVVKQVLNDVNLPY